MTEETGKRGPFVITRRVALATAPALNRQGCLSERIVKGPGILQLDVETDSAIVRITYDRSWIGFDGVAWALEQAGHPLRADPWTRLKASWYVRQDRKARTVGKLPESACCGQSPAIERNRDT